MPRLKKDTRTKRQQQKDFLAELETCGNITASCKKSKIDRKAVYRWKKADPAFLVEYEESVSIGIDALEDEATRRAFEGCEKPVFQQGRKVGSVKEYSDTLMIFLLKCRRPEVFKDRHEVTGKDGGPLEHDVTVRVIQAPTGVKPVSSEKDVDV